MKVFIVFCISAFVVFAHAQQPIYQYRCADRNGVTAYLAFYEGRLPQIQWHELISSKSTSGEFTGIETAPFSPRKGFLTFGLLDSSFGADSRNVLAVEPGISKGATQVRATLYFDHDDHDENERSLICQRVR